MVFAPNCGMEIAWSCDFPNNSEQLLSAYPSPESRNGRDYHDANGRAPIKETRRRLGNVWLLFSVCHARVMLGEPGWFPALFCYIGGVYACDCRATFRDALDTRQSRWHSNPAGGFVIEKAPRASRGAFERRHWGWGALSVAVRG